MAESNAVNHFRIPKRGEEQGKLLIISRVQLQY